MRSSYACKHECIHYTVVQTSLNPFWFEYPGLKTQGKVQSQTKVCFRLYLLDGFTKLLCVIPKQNIKTCCDNDVHDTVIPINTVPQCKVFRYSIQQ